MVVGRREVREWVWKHSGEWTTIVFKNTDHMLRLTLMTILAPGHRPQASRIQVS